MSSSPIFFLQINAYRRHLFKFTIDTIHWYTFVFLRRKHNCSLVSKLSDNICSSKIHFGIIFLVQCKSQLSLSVLIIMFVKLIKRNSNGKYYWNFILLWTQNNLFIFLLLIASIFYSNHLLYNFFRYEGYGAHTWSPRANIEHTSERYDVIYSNTDVDIYLSFLCRFHNEG